MPWIYEPPERRKKLKRDSQRPSTDCVKFMVPTTRRRALPVKPSAPTVTSTRFPSSVHRWLSSAGAWSAEAQNGGIVPVLAFALPARTPLLANGAATELNQCAHPGPAHVKFAIIVRVPRAVPGEPSGNGRSRKG